MFLTYFILQQDMPCYIKSYFRICPVPRIMTPVVIHRVTVKTVNSVPSYNIRDYLTILSPSILTHAVPPCLVGIRYHQCDYKTNIEDGHHHAPCPSTTITILRTTMVSTMPYYTRHCTVRQATRQWLSQSIHIQLFTILHTTQIFQYYTNISILHKQRSLLHK